MTVLYDAVIHIKRHFNTHQLFGEDNSKALKEDLDLLHAVKAAIINSVKNGNSLRGIINFEGTVREDDPTSIVETIYGKICIKCKWQWYCNAR